MVCSSVDARADGVYSTTTFYKDVYEGTFLAPTNLTLTLGTVTNGAFTNGSVTLHYRITATNSQGAFPISAATNMTWTGGTNTNNIVTVSWDQRDGVEMYIIERSANGSSWTNWRTMGPGATSFIDYGTTNLTLWTNGTYVPPAAIPAPSFPWASGDSNDWITVRGIRVKAESDTAQPNYAFWGQTGATNSGFLFSDEGCPTIWLSLTGTPAFVFWPDQFQFYNPGNMVYPQIGFGQNGVTGIWGEENNLGTGRVSISIQSADIAAFVGNAGAAVQPHLDMMGNFISNATYYGDGSKLTGIVAGAGTLQEVLDGGNSATNLMSTHGYNVSNGSVSVGTFGLDASDHGTFNVNYSNGNIAARISGDTNAGYNYLGAPLKVGGTFGSGPEAGFQMEVYGASRFNGHLIPDGSNLYDIGTTDLWWREAWINTLNVQGATINVGTDSVTEVRISAWQDAAARSTANETKINANSNSIAANSNYTTAVRQMVGVNSNNINANLSRINLNSNHINDVTTKVNNLSNSVDNVTWQDTLDQGHSVTSDLIVTASSDPRTFITFRRSSGVDLFTFRADPEGQLSMYNADAAERLRIEAGATPQFGFRPASGSDAVIDVYTNDSRLYLGAGNSDTNMARIVLYGQNNSTLNGAIELRPAIPLSGGTAYGTIRFFISNDVEMARLKLDGNWDFMDHDLEEVGEIRGGDSNLLITVDTSTDPKYGMVTIRGGDTQSDAFTSNGAPVLIQGGNAYNGGSDATGGGVIITGGVSVGSTPTGSSVRVYGGSGAGQGGDVELFGGTGTGNGNGGDVELFGGTYPSGGRTGGWVRIVGGERPSTDGQAGGVDIRGGNSGNGRNGANVFISGGKANTDTNQGGSVYVVGGTNTGNSGQGGDVHVLGGSGSSSPKGGNVYMAGGESAGTNVGGNAYISGGLAASGTNGGNVIISGGDAGFPGSVIITNPAPDTFASDGSDVLVYAGPAGGQGDGGNITLTAGISGTTGSKTGGTVTVVSGQGYGGNGGDIILRSADGRDGDAGDIRLEGGDSGSGGATENRGGDIFLTAGEAADNVEEPGSVYINGGWANGQSTTNKGNVNINGGDSSSDTAPAGDVTIKGGDRTGSNSGDGGNVFLVGGLAKETVSNRPGGVFITGGTNTYFEKGTGGVVEVRGGRGSTSGGVGGDLNLYGGQGFSSNGGDIVMIGGWGGNQGHPGDVIIRGGSNNVNGSQIAGDVFIEAGENANNSGTNGGIYLSGLVYPSDEGFASTNPSSPQVGWGGIAFTNVRESIYRLTDTNDWYGLTNGQMSGRTIVFNMSFHTNNDKHVYLPVIGNSDDYGMNFRFINVESNTFVIHADGPSNDKINGANAFTNDWKDGVVQIIAGDDNRWMINELVSWPEDVKPTASLYHNDESGTFDLSVAGYTAVTNWTGVTDVQGGLSADAATGIISNSLPGKTMFFVTGNFSFQGTSSDPDEDYVIAVHVTEPGGGAVEQVFLKTVRETEQNDMGSASFANTLELDQGDTVDVRVKVLDGSGDYTPIACQFHLHRLE